MAHIGWCKNYMSIISVKYTNILLLKKIVHIPSNKNQIICRSLAYGF